MLGIAVEKVAYIHAKAREFDVKVAAQDTAAAAGSAEPDDSDYRDILEDYGNDPTTDELRGAIDGLNEEEKINLVALFWLGRGDYPADEWADALAQARDRYNTRTADYLTGSPMLSDYLEEGMIKLGFSGEDLE